MSVLNALETRSGSKCELCGNAENLATYPVPPHTEDNADTSILICETCQSQINDPTQLDQHHWRCLNESMWSQIPAVQVMAWRMLNRLNAEGWARDLLDMLYLDDATLAWAQEQGDKDTAEEIIKHLDANGAVLENGDTVTLIKDLNVKGAGFTAKRGTAVRNISLVTDNAGQIEGRVNAQQIVILTEFVKKSS